MKMSAQQETIEATSIREWETRIKLYLFDLEHGTPAGKEKARSGLIEIGQMIDNITKKTTYGGEK